MIYMYETVRQSICIHVSSYRNMHTHTYSQNKNMQCWWYFKCVNTQQLEKNSWGKLLWPAQLASSRKPSPTVTLHWPCSSWMPTLTLRTLSYHTSPPSQHLSVSLAQPWNKHYPTFPSNALPQRHKPKCLSPFVIPTPSHLYGVPLTLLPDGVRWGAH